METTLHSSKGQRAFGALFGKLLFLAWVLAIIAVQWVFYGPYGPVGRFVGYQTIQKAQDLLLRYLSAPYGF